MASDDDAAPQQAKPTEFQNKLEKQAKAKGGLSYTYFAAAGGGSAGAPPPPRALTDEEAAALEAQAKAGNNGSAWNAAGTYEERDVSAWARARVEELLEKGGGGGAAGEDRAVAGAGASATPCGAVVVASAACTGEAHVFFVRGKRRAAFELAVSMGWRASGNAEIQGTAKTRESVTGDDVDDEDDVELTVALDAAVGGGSMDGGDAAAAAAAVRAAREGLRGVLCAKLRQLRQEMRDGLAT